MMKRKIYIAIVDDNPAMIKETQNKLKKSLSDLNHMNTDFIIDEFVDGTTFLSSNQEYDLVLMDYEMPEINGIETVLVLEQRKVKTKILFLSGYDKLIEPLKKANSIKISVGYLFKNDPFEQFRYEVNRVIKDILDVELITIKHYEVEIESNDRQQMQTFYESIIDVKKIVTIEASGKTIFAYMEDGDEYLTRRSLREWQAKLSSDDFAFANKGQLVNLKYVASIASKTVILVDSEIIKLSYAFKDSFSQQRRKYKIREALK